MKKLKAQGFKLRPCARCKQLERVYRPAWLRGVRVRAGLTLREFCRRVKRNPSFISNVETGKVRCPPWLAEEYQRLADEVLGLE